MHIFWIMVLEAYRRDEMSSRNPLKEKLAATPLQILKKL